jgi:hypothetical protein
MMEKEILRLDSCLSLLASFPEIGPFQERFRCYTEK